MVCNNADSESRGDSRYFCVSNYTQPKFFERTSLLFKWSKPVWFSNGLDFRNNLKFKLKKSDFKWLDHLKTSLVFTW
jgi:hypothetical protein